MKKCAKCDFEYNDAYDGCPRCAKTAEDRPTVKATSSMGGPTLVGLSGAVMLFVGVFLPTSSLLGITASYSSVIASRTQAIILLALAALSVLFVLVKRYRGLLITGGLSLGLLASGLVRLSATIAESKASVEAELTGELGASIGQAITQRIEWWGWAVLALGAVLLLAAWALSEARLWRARASKAASVST